MITVKQIALVILSSIGRIVLAFVFNFLIQYTIIIPDPCYYHTHDTSKMFDIFYELTSDNGYHPFPTMFNFIFTASIGAIIGLITSMNKIKKREARKTTKTL
jgi:hypothetical protein